MGGGFIFLQPLAPEITNPIGMQKDPSRAISSDAPSVPKHIAIIMDGNGRWAKERGKSRIDGHKEGALRVRDVMKAAVNAGVKYLTLYAFSSENWERPKDEVSALMLLLKTSLQKFGNELIENQVRFMTIGDISALPQDCISEIEKLKNATSKFRDKNLVLALNYGSRDEIARAVRKMLGDAKNGGLDAENVDWEKISKYLDTSDIPDPDLLIRTSGEMRLSNYLMLQSAYAEIYFTKVCWPEFGEKELLKAIEEFGRRERRYGKTAEQLEKSC